MSWFIEPREGGGGDNRRYRISEKKEKAPKRAEGGAEAEVDRAVLHILTVLRVPAVPINSVYPFSSRLLFLVSSCVT